MAGLSRTTLRRLESHGVDVLSVPIHWVFDSVTGECLGLISNPAGKLTVGSWGETGLIYGGLFPSRTAAFEYLMQQRDLRNQPEDGNTPCDTTS